MDISLKEKIIRVIDQLSGEEQRKLLELIKKLTMQPKPQQGLLDFVMEEADPGISLAQVRHELSAIQGNLSDVVIAERKALGL